MILLPAKSIIRKFPENYKAGELDFCKSEFAYHTANVKGLYFNKGYLNAHGHLYDHNFHIVPQSLVSPFIFKRVSFFSHLKKLVLHRKRQLPKGEQYISCFDEWSDNHYHWICDFLPRLVVVRADLPDSTLLLPNVPYIKNAGVKLLKYHQLMPKRIEWIEPGEIVKVNNMRLITRTVHTGRTHDDLQNQIKALGAGAKAGAKTSCRRIYISRAKAAYRKVLNETEVIALLKAYNFEVVDFDDLSIEQQIDLMESTAILVSIHGAGLTNAIFMQNGASVLEFRRDKIYHNQCYWHLSSATHLQYYYLFGQPDRDTVIEGPHGCNLTIPLVKLQETVEQMIQDTAL